MKNKLVSIVIPIYNAEKYLTARFEHLLSHNLENTQIVIVDDGSTDESREIYCKYLVNRTDTIIISQENKGLSVARNRGIEAATGEYILFLDSDDILLSEGFQEMQDYLLIEKPDVLMGKYVIKREKGRDIWPDYAFPVISSAAEARKVIYSEILDSVWNAWRYVCRRDFLIRHNLFFVPGLLCEDMEWSPRMLLEASSIKFLDKPFYGYYYNRPGSITRTAVFKKTLDVNNIVASSVGKYMSEDYGIVLAHRLARESFYCISGYFLCRKDKRRELRSAIEGAIGYYHLSSSSMIRLFLKFRGIVPLYIWSLSLWGAKTIRGMLKGLLGPLKIKI